MGVAGDSTKQLYNYTLPPSRKTPRIFEQRKLIKRCAGYVKLAQTAANIAKWEWRDILIALFQGSTYDAQDSGAVPGLPYYISPFTRFYSG
jgi:hypothetical protein